MDILSPSYLSEGIISFLFVYLFCFHSIFVFSLAFMLEAFLKCQMSVVFMNEVIKAELNCVFGENWGFMGCKPVFPLTSL